MKKVLFVTGCMPHDKIDHGGGQTFNYYIKGIKATKKFEVDVVALADSTYKSDAVQYGIKEHYAFCSNKRISKFKNIGFHYNPFHKYGNALRNLHADALVKCLEEMKKEGYYPDIIVLEWTVMVLLQKRIKKIFQNAKFIASEHDVTYLGYMRKIKFAKGICDKLFKELAYKNMKKREIFCLNNCDIVMPHNIKDRELLIKDGVNSSKIEVLTPYFMDMSSNIYNSNSKNIIFYGLMSRPENYLSAIWFINNVMSKLSDLKLNFVIVGSKPDISLQKLKCENIILTGYVDDLTPYFSDAFCFVAPLHMGAGIKIKVLEAMKAGLPVLTNSIGIEGIPAVSGKDYLMCDTSEDYEISIRKLLNREIDGKLISNNAKKFMDANFNIKTSLDDYVKRLERIGE